MCLLGPALPVLPPSSVTAEPSSPLLMPVSISVNPGALPALAPHGIELSLEHREGAEPTQKVWMRERGEARGCPLRGAPPPSSNTGSHLHSGVMSLLLHCLPSLLPGGILDTPTSVTTFQLQSFLKKQQCVSCGVILPAALPCTRCLQPVALPAAQLKNLSPSSVLVTGPAARATGTGSHLLKDALWLAALLGR